MGSLSRFLKIQNYPVLGKLKLTPGGPMFFLAFVSIWFVKANGHLFCQLLPCRETYI